ncbi:hypothetical protein HYDPIDRAFT_101797 [Hydnomerulius pinastri MD-312]|uniref:Uncharacterized protein n=1 Tax=Hydnomerulius pinastri MD-312 TaxID=994086 RepID=A0A0C9W8A9_9AGAM|nr:hypothetical protein HYDPIDRAFT_101797 [Hydnomerulius pinastri MD-312]
MPYPNTQPDLSVFEDMSEEYASVSTLGTQVFTPLTSSEALASLVSEGNFKAAETLRKEMISHHIPITLNALYLRAALNAITERRSKGMAKERLDAFEAWLSLIPDRHESWLSFYAIRERMFRAMDHLNISLVHRFGLVLASKGYFTGDAALQAASTLARHARPAVTENYLRKLEDRCRDYHLRTGRSMPVDCLLPPFDLAIRTQALAGRSGAALQLASTAQKRGLRVSDFTLYIVAKHAPDQHHATDKIRTIYPTWSMQPTQFSDESINEVPHTDTSTTISSLATHLRSLRKAFKSSSPPSPYALIHFITSYQALGRTRAPVLLRSLAYHHSSKSAATWAFAEMLHFRARREYIQTLLVFAQHFHLVGVPRTTLLYLIRGPHGRRMREEGLGRLVSPAYPMQEKLWPSPHHTAVVWETLVRLVPKADRERLYKLLLQLVAQSKQEEPPYDKPPERTSLSLPPTTYDAAHFSPFISMWAARRNPEKASEVLKDMVSLGIEPGMVQWSIVARGYAQHGDPLIALRILDRLEEIERGTSKGQSAHETPQEETYYRPSDTLIGTYTNVLQGFVAAEDVEHAREVERRLVERFAYNAGDRRATDAAIKLLRELENKPAQRDNTTQ